MNNPFDKVTNYILHSAWKQGAESQAEKIEAAEELISRYQSRLIDEGLFVGDYIQEAI